MVKSTAVKATNYTPQQEAQLAEIFSVPFERSLVESMALQLGKNTRSLTSKLSTMGLYTNLKKEAKTTKTGEVIRKKSDIVEDIAIKLGVNSELVESLEGCTKQTLHLILNALPKAD
jgi:hypothetical protein